MSPNAPRRPLPRFRATCRKTIKWGGLVLALLLAGVWVRSEFVFDRYESLSWKATSAHGSLLVELDGWVGRPGWRSSSASDEYVASYRSPKFIWGKQGHTMVLPLWMPLSLTLIATAAAWRLDALARRRERAGHCQKCGYDRAGLGASAVCPECGTASPQPGAAAPS